MKTQLVLTKRESALVDEIMTVLYNKVDHEDYVRLDGWKQDIICAASRMDEEEYGLPFLRAVKQFALRQGGRKVAISDRIVHNTFQEVCRNLAPMIGLGSHPCMNLLQNPTKETLLPEANYLLRTHRLFVRRNDHSITVQFTAEMHTDELEGNLDLIESACAQ